MKKSYPFSLQRRNRTAWISRALAVFLLFPAVFGVAICGPSLADAFSDTEAHHTVVLLPLQRDACDMAPASEQAAGETATMPLDASPEDGEEACVVSGVAAGTEHSLKPLTLPANAAVSSFRWTGPSGLSRTPFPATVLLTEPSDTVATPPPRA